MRLFSRSPGRGSELCKEAKPVGSVEIYYKYHNKMIQASWQLLPFVPFQQVGLLFQTPTLQCGRSASRFIIHTDISIVINMTVVPPSHLVLGILKVLRSTEHISCYPMIKT